MANIVGFDDTAQDGKLGHVAGAQAGFVELSALVPTPGLRRVESSEALNITLHQAARDGNVDSMRRLLDQFQHSSLKKKINQHDEDQLSPLHLAARYNHYPIVKMLVDRGANVNDKGEDSATPLHYAARYRRQRVTRSKSLEPDDAKLVADGLQKTETDDGEKESKSTEVQTNQSFPNEVPVPPKLSTTGTPQPVEDQSIIRYLVGKGAHVNAKDDYGLTPLHYAGMRGNEMAARDLLSIRGVAIEAVDKQQMTALHLAATHNHVDVAQLLIEAGASLRCVDEEQSTPLHSACMEGSEQIVRMLFEAGEKLDGWVTVSQMVTDQDCDGSTALLVAVENSHYEVAKLCIEKGSDVNTHRTGWNTALHLAAVSGDLRIVKLLLDHNARIDVLNDQQATPLHRAAAFDHADVCQFLIDRGAKLERRDKDNFTPLLLAACEGHPNTIKALLQRNADISALDKNDKTAIFWAAEEDNLAALEVLLNHSKVEEEGLIDASDRYDHTPLHTAAENGYVRIVKCLVEHGADLDCKNEEEQTPLHLACRYGRTNVAKELIKHDKMAVNDEDEDSNTPLHLAALSGHTKVTQALIFGGADIEARNCSLWTPLDCAAAKGWEKTCKVLLENDCPVDPMDKSKTTPLHLASARGHAGVVGLLLQWNANICQVDSDGNNCLDLAIDNNHKSVALTIINSPSWMDAMRNENIDISSGMRNTPMRKLIKKMPDIAEKVFMKCTTASHANPEHPKYRISFNYEFLDDMYSIWKSSSATSDSGSTSENVYDEDFKLKPDAKPYTTNVNTMKKNHCLMLMVTSKREDLLAHPLVTALLHHKWNSYGRYFYYFNFISYLFFLIFLTSYMILGQKYAPVSNLKILEKLNGSNSFCEEMQRSQNNLSLSTYAVFCKYAIIILAGILLLQELIQIYQSKANYFSYENIIEWFVYVSAIVVVIDFQNPCQSDTGLRLQWQWQLGAVCIFWAWMDLVLFIRKMPRFGIYVVMFTDVFGTFLHFFPVLLLFIFAFAFTFHALLGTKIPFGTVFSSIMKTSVMTIGEFEFDDIFNDTNDPVLFGVVTYMQFIFFLIVMSILVMNLLVGLAVDDIKAVQEQAVLKRLAMQVELVLEVEALVPQFILRKFVRKCETIKPNRKMNWFKKTFSSGAALSASAIATALNPELDQLEQIQDEQEKLREDVNRMRYRLKEISTQNSSIIEMLNVIMKAQNIEFEAEDAVDEAAT